MNMPFSRRATLGTLVALVCSPALSAPLSTLTLEHARGQAAVPARPLRVVVYDVGALDTLHALGVPIAGGARAQMPGYLTDYVAGYTSAGSLFEPDYDVLSSIRPDLVIVGGRSASRYDILSRIAPTLDLSVRGGQMLQDITRNITTLATLFGKAPEVKVLVDNIRQQVAGLRSLTAQAEPGLLLMGFNQRITPQAPGSRFGFLFDVFGVRSAIGARDIPARGTAYTFEDVARLNPAWIYVIDRNTATGSAAGGGAVIASQQVFDNPQVKGTVASRKGQVVFLDPKGWYLMGSAGPTALLGNVAQLRAAHEAAARG